MKKFYVGVRNFCKEFKVHVIDSNLSQTKQERGKNIPLMDENIPYLE